MRAALALILGSWCVSCEATATEIVVVVDSDLRAGSELTEIVAQTTGATYTFPIADDTSLPLTFGLVPGEGQSDRSTVRLTIQGRNADGASVVEALTVTSFRPNRRLVLPVPLARSCVGVEGCRDRDEATCRDGVCVSPDVDSTTLEQGNGSGVRLFDGPSEADAGVPLEDGGPTCLPGSGCEVSAGCASGSRVCDPTPDCVELTFAPAGTECGDGRLCDGMGTCGR